MSTSELLPSDRYILERGFAASARLNLMHYLWQEQHGYLVHPDIHDKIPTENAKIAELGTGTGIWLLDLARHMPSSTQLDGFDISIDQCPPKEWLPDNVTMSILDSLGPVPEHLTGKYDVIHLRHLLLVVPDKDPSILIKNVMQMLKPGGFVQWGELDFDTVKFFSSRPEGSAQAIQDLYEYIGTFTKGKGGKIKDELSWVSNLDKELEKHGFVDVATTRKPFDRAFYAYQLHTALLTWEEIIFKLLDRLGKEHGDKGRELLKKAYAAGRAGASWDVERQTLLGRKPI